MVFLEAFRIAAAASAQCSCCMPVHVRAAAAGKHAMWHMQDGPDLLDCLGVEASGKLPACACCACFQQHNMSKSSEHSTHLVACHPPHITSYHHITLISGCRWAGPPRQHPWSWAPTSTASATAARARSPHARSFDDYGGPFKQVGFRLLAAELQGLGGRGDT